MISKFSFGSEHISVMQKMCLTVSKLVMDHMDIMKFIDIQHIYKYKITAFNDWLLYNRVKHNFKHKVMYEAS